ncbi:DUF2891 domain-containing protein [Flavobacterium sp. HSC-61S13]|uniref:DUF2891 domain-containing protein n=1 Tax=Flavobacterium sp. HSC-61S13 TaxID=2910963 RepID=UPI00209F0B36|nr:DUF2891 domain-containing protein [Flavobacterium sp. HSC-61S13]MCP1997502.1 hypothetical protein [Flavobacterium sp. HSC-61S13]
MRSMFLFISLLLLSCQQKTDEKQIVKDRVVVPQLLDVKLAKRIFELPVHCLTQEYPNKLGQVLGSSKDLKSPKTLRPLFYGCFDWHSAVHGYWSIVTLMELFPELDSDGQVRHLLDQHITAENVQVEINFFNDVNNTSFERTYGWAWMFALQQTLEQSDDPQYHRWAKILRPLSDLMVERYTVYLPKLMYPIRTGQHDNSAFSLSLALDYARAVEDKDFEALLVSQSKRLFVNDVSCSLTYEPSGYDFLSPCLEEARLLTKILPQVEYRIWLKKFLPQLFKSDFALMPAEVSDRTDGKLVHLDGLNFSRASCFYDISKVLPELSYLEKVGESHYQYSIGNISNDDYMGSHWLGTFAIYAILNR